MTWAMAVCLLAWLVWVTHTLLPRRVCTDARRRVLARKPYSLLPPGMRCGS